ncbi:MAG: DUF1178 family protein [Rhodoferax sp.]|uniref:DUF1178 family protein n=1 Tax=Rhodoferax sp. TaxID=50421 RepID=UPI002635D49A|nr:DUF1178 family protein [Rhodoferax sp.]MDD2879087.1 DUF1178 family protein [Rhodoferax sp.]
MKVLDLQCGQTHVFEGWFSSEDDFLTQMAQAKIHCPVCGSASVSKRLSAPRLNFGAARAPVADGASDDVTVAQVGVDVTDPLKAMQQLWLNACRHIVANTADVGTGFAEEARKMHYGEAPVRAIRGQATSQETHALIDEGIAVLPLLLPDGMLGPSQ